MSEVKRYTTNEAYAMLPYGAKVVPEADYDALQSRLDAAEAEVKIADARESRANDVIRENDRLRQQLAERDSVLRECRKFTDDLLSPGRLRERIDALLSSAEPANPKSSAPLNACGGCEGGYGFLIGHDSSKEEPLSIRCGHCYREVRAKEHEGLAGAWNSANPAKGGDGDGQS